MCVDAPAPGPTTPIDGSMCATPSMPLQFLEQLERDLGRCLRARCPSGASTWTVHSPMSSFGTNSRPTMRFSGKRQQDRDDRDAR